jgi:hypothetical protein
METDPGQQAQVQQPIQQANEVEKVASTLAQLAIRALNPTTVDRDGNHEEENQCASCQKLKALQAAVVAARKELFNRGASLCRHIDVVIAAGMVPVLYVPPSRSFFYIQPVASHV